MDIDDIYAIGKGRLVSSPIEGGLYHIRILLRNFWRITPDYRIYIISTAILGYGFPENHFKRIEKSQVIAVDSLLILVPYLESGLVYRSQVRKGFELMLCSSAEPKIPPNHGSRWLRW